MKRNMLGTRPSRRIQWTTALLILLLQLATVVAQNYRAGNRRDPFIDLSKEQQKAAPTTVAPPPFAQRPPGLPGLLISEVSVVGTAANNNQRIVILKGADDFTYVAREGTRLYDGFVETVSTDEVVFVREVFDTTGKKTVSKVAKRSS